MGLGKSLEGPGLICRIWSQQCGLRLGDGRLEGKGPGVSRDAGASFRRQHHPHEVRVCQAQSRLPAGLSLGGSEIASYTSVHWPPSALWNCLETVHFLFLIKNHGLIVHIDVTPLPAFTNGPQFSCFPQMEIRFIFIILI